MFPKLPSLYFTPRADRPRLRGPWSGHRPFAYDLVAEVKPSLVVELGTFYGDSYFTFCEAVSDHHLETLCYAVDTWKGDPQGGFYGDEVFGAVQAHNDRLYQHFSYLLRMRFDEAYHQFAEHSIDLLNIDGYHTYDAVKSDFGLWQTKVKPGGVILLHDTAIRVDDFGVWRFWDELAGTSATFSFPNSCGLGVLVKPPVAGPLSGFLSTLLDAKEEEREEIRRYYALCAERLDHWSWRVETAPDAPGKTRVQVFYCRDAHYREEDSVVRTVNTGDWVHVTFDLAHGAGSLPLRLDPGDRPCGIEIRDLTLRSPVDRSILWQRDSGTALKVGGTAVRIPDAERCLIFSFGVDPMLFLPHLEGECFRAPVTLDFWIKVDPGFTDAARWIGTDFAGELERLGREMEAEKARNRKAEGELTRTRQELHIGEISRTELVGVIQRLQRELDSIKAD